jgi:hypothetical protein
MEIKMNTMTMRGAGSAVLALAATFAFGASVQAQADTQSLFPFLGCWAPEAGVGPTLCIRPTVDGLELARVAEGEVASREAFSLSPAGLTTEMEGCSGEHFASVSADGYRIFTTSEFICEGGGLRSESGLLTLLDGEVLLDVRSVEVADDPVAWVQSYRATSATVGLEAGIADLPLPGMALETARRAASQSISVDDVVEAHRVVGDGTVEAWLAETGDGFDLDAETLIALSDGGLPESVIDLMIVVSHPDRFALAVSDGDPAMGRGGTFVGSGPRLSARGRSSCYGYDYGMISQFGNPFFYEPYSSGCGYRYSRYSYGPYGYSGGWYGPYYNPGIIIAGGGGGGGGTARDNGRVVRGRGYTRGDRGTAPPPSSGTVGSSGGSSGSAPPPAPARRAKPRPAGGGGGGR